MAMNNSSFHSQSNTDGNVSSSGDCMSKRPSYKRACERPAALVARRNARERGRVQMVNGAFERLRRHLPYLKLRQKRVAKLKILRAAIDYIYDLQDELDAAETNLKQPENGRIDGPVASDCPIPVESAAMESSSIPHQLQLQSALGRQQPKEFQLLHDYDIYRSNSDVVGSYQNATLPLCSSSCVYKPDANLLLAHYNQRMS